MRIACCSFVKPGQRPQAGYSFTAPVSEDT